MIPYYGDDGSCNGPGHLRGYEQNLIVCFQVPIARNNKSASTRKIGAEEERFRILLSMILEP